MLFPLRLITFTLECIFGKYDVRSGEIIPIINKQEYVSTNGKTTVWRNFTSLEVSIDADAEIADVSVPTNVVESESILPIKVKIRSNVIGKSYMLSVQDLNSKDIIAKRDIEITEPEMTISLDVNVPKASKSEEIHIWRISLNGVDWNEENNQKTISITIRSNNTFLIPGFELISSALATIISLKFVRKMQK